MLFRLDFQSAVPIYRQIRDQVVLAVAQGELTPGERLPTTRALAAGEARLAGLTLDDFVAACKAAFGETED